MNNKVLKTLEYNKIIEKLTLHASSPLGQDMCRKLTPMTDIKEIKKAQTETSDALARLWHSGSVSFSGTRDIGATLKRLEIGSCLSIKELLDISSVLNVTLRIKSFSRNTSGKTALSGGSPFDESTLSENKNDADNTDSEDKRDSLSEMFDGLEPLSGLNNEIKRCIISEDDIDDNASSTLSSIRRSMKRTNEKIHNQLNSMVNSQTVRANLQDFVITMRNGRYCLPVKADCKGNMPGMIHDQSSTGSTIFVEPMAVVQLNNELRELEIKEKAEIEKILADLSNMCGEHTEELKYNLETLSVLDFIFARAALSKEYKCCEPVINTDGIINIKCGRHPLLDQSKVVPINIHLGDAFDLLIVTGPNTGGKTVSLKTVGLFTLMGQSGLHIPADDGSVLSIFTEVYADIGDEQSIEQSLSTFSSHMTNIVNILEKADDKSLVLFDEICAGTDPIEGAALAISILTFLHNMKIRTMTTTHYSELKLFALSTDGAENACCEFSVETLSPTYRLLIGIPGKSNAFAIAGKLGLPSYIIDDAKTRIDSDSEAFEDIISDLEESKLEIEREHTQIKAYKEEIEKLKAELEKKSEKLDDRRERILREANEEAQSILQEAKSFADEAIREINKLSADGLTKDMEKQRTRLREKLGDTQGKLTLNGKKQKKELTPKDIKLGDAVRVLSLGVNGHVSGLPNNKGDMYVQMGILRSQVNIRDIELIDEPVITGPNLTKTNKGKIRVSKSVSISSEINLIGMTTDEAVAALDKYLDDAYLAHLKSVRIVHGRGTGALRNAVHKYLKRQKHVDTFRLGVFGEGDTGVTIVEFKD